MQSAGTAPYLYVRCLFPMQPSMSADLVPFLSFGRASEPLEVLGPDRPQLQPVVPQARLVLPVVAAPLRHGKSPFGVVVMVHNKRRLQHDYLQHCCFKWCERARRYSCCWSRSCPLKPQNNMFSIHLLPLYLPSDSSLTHDDNAGLCDDPEASVASLV